MAKNNKKNPYENKKVPIEYFSKSHLSSLQTPKEKPIYRHGRRKKTISKNVHPNLHKFIYDVGWFEWLATTDRTEKERTFVELVDYFDFL